MENDLKKMIGLWAGTVLALVLGMLAGFFFVFNSIFSDGPLGERLFAFVLIFGIYIILGLIFASAWPGRTKRWFWVLVSPALLIVTLYSVREYSGIPLHALVLVFTCAGAYLGLTIRSALKR